MDANEDIYRKLIGRSLTNLNELNMREVVGEFSGKKIGPTFFQGSKTIDGIWATSDLIVTHACVMPAGFGVGDHPMFIINFQKSSMVGSALFQVQHFSSRRLNTKVLIGMMQKYINRLEENIFRHRLIEKLGIFAPPTRQEEDIST
jgi:hypothetical protein